MSTLNISTRIAIQNILLSTDFSPISDMALSYGVGLARRYHSTLFVVNVVPSVPHDFLPPDPFPESRVSMEKMRSWIDNEQFHGIPHNEFVEQGEVAEVLHALVDKHNIDLIVLGTHGRTGIQKLLLGSVAEDIFRRAQCLVLTVGPRVSPEIGSGDLRNILYATDFGEETKHVLPYALSLAEEHHARLTLLHAASPPPILQDWEPNASPEFQRAESVASAEAQLRRMLPPDAQLVTRPEFLVGIGEPAHIIHETARKVGADVIVLGVKRPMALTTHFGAGTAYKVVCEAACPVLTVGHEFRA